MSRSRARLTEAHYISLLKTDVAWLDAVAKATGKTMAALVREGIDLLRWQAEYQRFRSPPK